jgi:hypothetical protein
MEKVRAVGELDERELCRFVFAQDPRTLYFVRSLEHSAFELDPPSVPGSQPPGDVDVVW